MSQNLRTVVISEFYAACKYMERVLDIIYGLENIFVNNSKESSMLVDLMGRYYQELHGTGEQYLFSFAQKKDIADEPLDVPKIVTATKDFTHMYVALLKMDFETHKSVCPAVLSINTIYRYARKFHVLALAKEHFDIQFPPLNLIQSMESEPEKEDTQGAFFDYYLPIEKEYGKSVPHFYLSPDTLKEFIDSGHTILSVHSLPESRENRYTRLIEDGRVFASQGKYDNALKKLTQARQIKESAEVLNSLGHVYSLMKRYREAKEYCLKAVSKEPDYGPPYNDFGCYLLEEGYVEESFKWFERAKKCTRYDDRERSYINTGRAYMEQNYFVKALEEYKTAIKINPLLQKRSKKIIKNLEKIIRTRNKYGIAEGEDPKKVAYRRYKRYKENSNDGPSPEGA